MAMRKNFYPPWQEAKGRARHFIQIDKKTPARRNCGPIFLGSCSTVNNRTQGKKRGFKYLAIKQDLWSLFLTRMVDKLAYSTFSGKPKRGVGSKTGARAAKRLNQTRNGSSTKR